MEEVVLLLAEGQGPTDHCDLIQAKNVTTLAGIKGQRWTPDDAEDKWVAALLPADAEATYTGLRNGDGFSSLQSWGETTLGMVTGNNRYFALNIETVRKLHLKANELMKLCPPGSRHLRGLGFTERAWKDMTADGSAGYLFDPSVKRQSAHALAYGSAQK